MNTLKDESKLPLSFPFIPRISEEYLKNRFVIVGQETNTWYKDKGDYRSSFIGKDKNEVYKQAFDERYDKFIEETALSYKGRFWDFNRYLYQPERNILQGQMVNEGRLSHSWINLFCMEAMTEKNRGGGKPTKDKKVRDEVLRVQKNLTFMLLQLLEPNFIIFLTGPGLDWCVDRYALGGGSIDRISIDDQVLEAWHSCEIKLANDNPLSTARIFRFYHPTYFLSRINTHKKLKEKITTNESVAKYYERVVMNKLHEAVK